MNHVSHPFHLNLQVEKITREMEAKCDQKVADCKEESRQYLMHVQEEHASLVCQESGTSLVLLNFLISSFNCTFVLNGTTNISHLFSLRYFVSSNPFLALEK